MAFKDANGRITIDEVAARKDINNLYASIECLSGVEGYLNQIISSAQTFKGDTGNQIFESASELLGEIKAYKDMIAETCEDITRVVAKYQKIDAEVRDMINNAL